MALDWTAEYLDLFIGLAILVAFGIGYAIASLRKSREVASAVQFARTDTARRQRSTVGGQIAEALRPYIGDFPYDPSDLTFIGDPVDFIAFNGKAAGRVEEVVFIEVKSGASSLKPTQRQVRDAINAGRVRWVESRFPGPPGERQVVE